MATADRNAAADEMRKLRPFLRDGRIIAIFLGFLDVGVPGEQRLLGVGPELVAPTLDGKGRPPEELRVLVGLPDDDLDGAPVTGGDRSRIAVPAFQELDQSPPQRMLPVTEDDAA